ncbi:gamma-glutamyl-gamma-aminobutyrate hydrolase family protein [Streptococcus fryi]
MSKPIIGITANQRLKRDLDNIPWAYAPAGFVEAIKKAGGIPLLLPIGDEEAAKEYVNMVDKVILTGGQNVDPQFYGEEKKALKDDYSLERDLYEIAIIKESLKQNKPLFTVCRGMQLTNVVLGGNLNQHIEDHWQSEEPNVLTQTISISDDSSLSKIYGTETKINSFHRQSIKKLADGLKVIARSPEDDTIEAITFEDPDKHFLGVQWHPEFLCHTRDIDQALFDYIVNEL